MTTMHLIVHPRTPARPVEATLCNPTFLAPTSLRQCLQSQNQADQPVFELNLFESTLPLKGCPIPCVPINARP
jgi:hypothetical protein